MHKISSLTLFVAFGGLFALRTEAELFVVARPAAGRFPTLQQYADNGQFLGDFPPAQPVRSEELSSLTVGPDNRLYVLGNILGGGEIIRADPVNASAQWLLAPTSTGT